MPSIPYPRLPAGHNQKLKDYITQLCQEETTLSFDLACTTVRQEHDRRKTDFEVKEALWDLLSAGVLELNEDRDVRLANRK